MEKPSEGFKNAKSYPKFSAHYFTIACKNNLYLRNGKCFLYKFYHKRRAGIYFIMHACSMPVRFHLFQFPLLYEVGVQKRRKYHPERYQSEPNCPAEEYETEKCADRRPAQERQ